MLDHYHTPRDLLVSVPDLNLLEAGPLVISDPILADLGTVNVNVNVNAKPRAVPGGPAVIDLSALALEQLVAFDCDDDSGSESGSDDGYVSTLLRIQRAVAPIMPTPRKIAGARKVARAVSAPQPVRSVTDVGSVGAGGMDVEENMPVDAGTSTKNATEGELFQSITAIPGLQSTSFEELRLETYLQSLVATGTARPHPALAPPLVIPPAFEAQFVEAPEVEVEGADADSDVEMTDVSAIGQGKTRDPRTRDPRMRVQAPSAFRAASYPPASASQQWA